MLKQTSLLAIKEREDFLLNLMSSPGSGKTTVLIKTIEMLRDELKIGVMEADIDSAVDAEKCHRQELSYTNSYFRSLSS